MSAVPNRAEIAFEEMKDDPHVQAILTQVGTLRKHVLDWEMNRMRTWNRYLRRWDDEVTYRVILRDGQEIRGEIFYVEQHNEWIASGKIIPQESGRE
jgi:hypothetical protein